MKKTLSVFLAALMIMSLFVPAFAAGEGNTCTLSFTQPSHEFEGAYIFVESKNGQIQFEEDPDGIYVFYDNRYMTMDNIFPDYQDEVPPERYSPVQFAPSNQIQADTTVTFQVMTSEKYNLATAVVFINGVRAAVNANREYSVYMDKDINVYVAEYDEDGNPALLRNYYTVKLPSGEGFRAETKKMQNYQVAYYGDSFEFRVRVFNGFNASGIKVKVARPKMKLKNTSEEINGMMGMLGESEELQSLGVDADGCRMYRIDNITTNCIVSVSGIVQQKSVGIFAMLKRILRLILNLFGIDSSFLGSITSYYNIEINNEVPGVTYEVLRANPGDEIAPSKFQVTGGEGISIILEKKSLDQQVNVIWTPGNETGAYKTDWKVKYDPMTAETTYTAIYNIDNIKADTVISIYQ